MPPKKVNSGKNTQSKQTTKKIVSVDEISDKTDDNNPLNSQIEDISAIPSASNVLANFSNVQLKTSKEMPAKSSKSNVNTQKKKTNKKVIFVNEKSDKPDNNNATNLQSETDHSAIPCVSDALLSNLSNTIADMSNNDDEEPCLLNETVQDNDASFIEYLSTKHSAKKAKKITPGALKKARELQCATNFSLLVESGVMLIDLPKNKRKDVAWDSFKNLQIGTEIDTKSVVCAVCWQIGRVTKFSSATSLTGLKLHLNNEHSINLKNPRMKTIDAIMKGTGDISTKHEELVIRLTLRYIMTMTPFHKIENPNEREFLVSVGVVESVEDCPSERNLSDSGLEKINRYVEEEVIKILKESPHLIVVLFDAWSDKANNSYFAIIVRFLSKNFEVIELLVVFKKMEYKDSETELEMFKDMVVKFELQDKKLYAVSDKGSDMIRVSRLLEMGRGDCVAHGLHNLINADVLPGVPEVKIFLSKLRDILGCLRYRMSDIQKDIKLENDASYAEWLNKCCNLANIMDDEKDYCRITTERLKRDVSTRWTSTHEMLKSFISKENVINKWMGYMGRGKDLTISIIEKELIRHLLIFFEIFAKTTKIIEGSKYSTVNLSIVFFEEIKSQLEKEKLKILKECGEFEFQTPLLSLYEIAQLNLERRFGITKEMVVATMMDPLFQNCDYISLFLEKKNQTRNEFFREMYNLYVPVDPTIRSNIEHEENQNQTFLQSLAKKYSKLNIQDDFDSEIMRFTQMHTRNADEDILIWWGTVGITQFPLLSKLARIIFQISASSATVERLNSVAGATLTKDRLNMNHQKVDQIMFVHYNYPQISKAKDSQTN